MSAMAEILIMKGIRSTGKTAVFVRACLFPRPDRCQYLPRRQPHRYLLRHRQLLVCYIVRNAEKEFQLTADSACIADIRYLLLLPQRFLRPLRPRCFIRLHPLLLLPKVTARGANGARLRFTAVQTGK